MVLRGLSPDLSPGRRGWLPDRRRRLATARGRPPQPSTTTAGASGGKGDTAGPSRHVDGAAVGELIVASESSRGRAQTQAGGFGCSLVVDATPMLRLRDQRVATEDPWGFSHETLSEPTMLLGELTLLLFTLQRLLEGFLNIFENLGAVISEPYLIAACLEGFFHLAEV